MTRWKIDYYESSSGRKPVREFIEHLAEKSRSRVYYSLELLAEFGINLQAPHVKKLVGTPLWELRILGETAVRFFYFAKTGQSFLLLHGFVKHQQKTPPKEIKIALKRFKESKTCS